MAFDKNIPTEISEYELYDVDSMDELNKVANSALDIPEGFEYDPDYFYLWIRIISSGEYYGPNKNGDYFPNEELMEYYTTFQDAHVFKNHENKKIEKAIGKIFSVRWNPVMKCAEIFKGIDRKLAPEIVRGFEKGFLTDVSMGCKVPYTVCSVCSNKARKRSEFCDHVNKYRMGYLGNGERVFEINYEPKFHDSSVVLNGAERVAKALMVYNENDLPTLVSSFRKAASTGATTRFVRLTDQELEKVASHEQTEIHPLLRPYNAEKLASTNPVMTKIAELEKEVTGKILNIVTSPSEVKPKAAEQLVQIVKFLTEKRMDEGTLEEIGSTLNSIAKAENVSVSKAFSTFIGVAELMGIELFPTELHTVLRSITSSRFDDSMKLSDTDKEEVYPSDFARGVKKTLKATEQLPTLDDPSDLFRIYDDFGGDGETFKSNPIECMDKIRTGNDLEDEASTQIVRVIRKALEPFMGMRSNHSEHLLPRLSVVLGGHRSLLGAADVAKDINLLDTPRTFGDMLAGIAYSQYQGMRPGIIQARLVKSAQFFDSDLEKIANENKPTGIKRRTLLMTAVPAIYGASAFQRNRRENGRNTSDAQNFLADNPAILSAGVVVAGKPLTRGIMKGQQEVRRGIGKGYMAASKATGELGDRIKGGFDKLTSEEYKGLLKIADSLDSGDFLSMGEDMMSKFASDYGFNSKETATIKMATLLEYSGMTKEASSMMRALKLEPEAMGEFLKAAAVHTDGELDKAANEFTNTLLLDGMLDRRSISTTAHGRLLDAFVMKKIGDLGKTDKPSVTTPKVEGANSYAPE